MGNKTLVLLRGLPGSGKSTLGSIISHSDCHAADDFFDYYRNGQFRAEDLPAAHKYCKDMTEIDMREGVEVVTVANTFTRGWEMKDYLDLAKKYGYTVHTVIVENRHGNESVHDVPEETIEKMRNRFQIKL